MNRREAVKLLAGGVLGGRMASRAKAPAASFRLNSSDEALLDDIQRRGCLYFVEQASPNTGQVLDRAKWVKSEGALDKRKMSSIAATGFGLTALCIAEQRGFQPRTQVMEQVRRTLDYHLNTLPHDHGFFWHFNDVETGKPWRNVEISSIDTSLLLCGVLTARAHFHCDAEIVDMATQIYERVDWPWMMNGGDTFSMGFQKGKFLGERWNHYCELMMIYLLAMGSPTHPVDASAWDEWSRPEVDFLGFKYIGASDPLFVHQYSHAWFDFRNKRDRYADYFANSIVATQAHEAYCLALGKPYSGDYWGVSASDSEHGYVAWGGPEGRGLVDGSVVPYTTVGSLPFAPEACLRVQHALRANYGEKAWGRYGFCDAFHPQAGWYDPDVLGIDLGIGVLMAENLRSGFVWKTFARNPEVGIAMKKAGFCGV